MGLDIVKDTGADGLLGSESLDSDEAFFSLLGDDVASDSDSDSCSNRVSDSFSRMDKEEFIRFLVQEFYGSEYKDFSISIASVCRLFDCAIGDVLRIFPKFCEHDLGERWYRNNKGQCVCCLGDGSVSVEGYVYFSRRESLLRGEFDLGSVTGGYLNRDEFLLFVMGLDCDLAWRFKVLYLDLQSVLRHKLSFVSNVLDRHDDNYRDSKLVGSDYLLTDLFD